MDYLQKPPPPQDSGSRVVTIAVCMLLLVLLLAAGGIGAAFWIFDQPRDEAVAPAVKKTESTVAEGFGLYPWDEHDGRSEVETRINTRLVAAQLISDQGYRNDAYAQIAEDAAKSGLSDLALTTLSRINDLQQRDVAALSVVRALDEAEKEEQALHAAQLIREPGLRDEALRGIAGGQWPEAEVDVVTDEAVEAIEDAGPE